MELTGHLALQQQITNGIQLHMAMAYLLQLVVLDLEIGL
jgi:hypothetical protein